MLKEVITWHLLPQKKKSNERVSRLSAPYVLGATVSEIETLICGTLGCGSHHERNVVGIGHHLRVPITLMFASFLWAHDNMEEAPKEVPCLNTRHRY